MALEITTAEDMAVRQLCGELKELRIAKGISQKAIAESMGMAQPNYQRLENATYIPKLTTLQVWARALGLRVEFNLVEDGDILRQEIESFLQ